MTQTVAWSIAVLAISVGAYAAWHARKRYQFSNQLFYCVAVLELALIAALIGGTVALARTDRDVDGVLFVSYLVTQVFIPPVAVVWGIADKSRWGAGVVVVAMFTVAVLCARIHQIWVAPSV